MREVPPGRARGAYDPWGAVTAGICLGSRKINLSDASAAQLVGMREADDHVWQVRLLQYDLG